MRLPQFRLRTLFNALGFVAVCGVCVALLSPFFAGRSIELDTVEAPKLLPPRVGHLRSMSGQAAGIRVFDEKTEVRNGKMPSFFVKDGKTYLIDGPPQPGQREAVYYEIPNDILNVQ